MKIVTWNVNGIRARHAEVHALIEAESPDVLCLQEIKAAPAQVPDLLMSTNEHWTYWHGGGGYSGVAVIVRHGFVMERPAFHHPYFDMEHRIVVADVGSAIVASVYVPNGGKDYDAKIRFFTALAAWAGETIGTGRDVALFAQMLDAGLVDLGRSLDPDNNELFTWWAPWRNLRQRNIGWRIDYVLASPGIAARATTAAARRDFGTSDHGPLVVQFADRAGASLS
jgi:exodeoxyribonuclease-3